MRALNLIIISLLLSYGCNKISKSNIQKILLEDYDINRYSGTIDNSEIFIHTKGSGRIAKIGKSTTPLIIEIMEETNDFNLFTRCFCALQILYNTKFEWIGGLEVDESNGKLVFYNPVIKASGDFSSKTKVINKIKDYLKSERVK